MAKQKKVIIKNSLDFKTELNNYKHNSRKCKLNMNVVLIVIVA